MPNGPNDTLDLSDYSPRPAEELSDAELRRDYFEARIERIACIRLLQCGGGVTDKQIAQLRKRADDSLRIMEVIEKEQARRGK